MKTYDVEAEGKRIIALCHASPNLDLQKHGTRMEHCGINKLAIVADCDGDAPFDADRPEMHRDLDGLSMAVGCRSRLCARCNALRRGRMDRKYRPHLVALQAEGHPVLFVTLTRSAEVSRGKSMRGCFDEFRSAFGELRRGGRDAGGDKRGWRTAMDWWSKLVACGLYCLENTLYERHPEGHEHAGEIKRTRSGAPLNRRNHVHLHAVLVLALGTCPVQASAAIQAAWLGECAERGWYAEAAAQKLVVVDGAGLEAGKKGDALNYIVKYMSKPDDVTNERDAIEVLDGCKGLRTVQTIGVMHGTALLHTRRSVDALEHLGLLDDDAAHVQRCDEAIETTEALAWLAPTAATVAEEQGRDAAQAMRQECRELERTLKVIRANDERDAAVTWRTMSASTRALVDLASRAKTDARSWAEVSAWAAQEVQERDAEILDRLNKAQARVAREELAVERWSGRVQRCMRDVARASLEALLAGARVRLAGARSWLSLCQQWHAARVGRVHDGGRSTVLAERRKQDAETVRYRALVRDDFDSIALRIAREETGAHEVDLYTGIAHASRTADELVRQTTARLESARRRLFDAQDWMDQVQGAGVYRKPGADLTGRTGDRDAIDKAVLEVQEAAREAEAARMDRTILLGRMPVAWATVQACAELGDPDARCWVKTIVDKDAEREAKRVARAAARLAQLQADGKGRPHVPRLPRPASSAQLPIS